jgi:hypothetical protein
VSLVTFSVGQLNLPPPCVMTTCNGDTALGDQQPHGDPTHPAEERPQLDGSGPVSLVTFRVVSPISLHHPSTIPPRVSHLSVGHRLCTVSHLAFQCCSLPPEDNPHPHVIAHSTSPTLGSSQGAGVCDDDAGAAAPVPLPLPHAPWPATPPPTPAP